MNKNYDFIKQLGLTVEARKYNAVFLFLNEENTGMSTGTPKGYEWYTAKNPGAGRLIRDEEFKSAEEKSPLDDAMFKLIKQYMSRTYGFNVTKKGK